MFGDDGVQIIDVTDPADITAEGSIGDGSGKRLDGPRDLTTFVVGDSTYLAVVTYQ